MLSPAFCLQEGLGKDLELLYVGCLQVDIPLEEQEVRERSLLQDKIWNFCQCISTGHATVLHHVTLHTMRSGGSSKEFAGRVLHSTEHYSSVSACSTALHACAEMECSCSVAEHTSKWCFPAIMTCTCRHHHPLLTM